MMGLILTLLLLSSGGWASPPIHWSALLEIRERHEFYQNNEVIAKPKDAWQTLFAVVFPDRSLQLNKDCVFYRVPGIEDGVFKVKSTRLEDDCEKHIHDKGDLEIDKLKALQFTFDKELTLHFTFANYRIVRWNIPLLNQFRPSPPALFKSSAEQRAPKIILLAPVKKLSQTIATQNKGNTLCHSISDDCSESGPSTCQQCPEGWYEVPNGCPQGPKYCGNQICGQKNKPACRRGLKYQRESKKFECAQDTSFAYCLPGLSIQCEGAMAFCR